MYGRMGEKMVELAGWWVGCERCSWCWRCSWRWLGARPAAFLTSSPAGPLSIYICRRPLFILPGIILAEMPSLGQRGFGSRPGDVS